METRGVSGTHTPLAAIFFSAGTGAQGILCAVSKLLSGFFPASLLFPMARLIPRISNTASTIREIAVKSHRNTVDVQGLHRIIAASARDSAALTATQPHRALFIRSISTVICTL